MIFSKTCEYALKATLFISSQGPDQVIGLPEIAEAIGSPRYFTGKILQSLARHKILSSIKGPNGGFFMTKAQLLMTLYDVVIAVEGNDYFDRCVLGLENCSNEHPCPVHKYLIRHKSDIRDLFRKRNIQSYFNDVQGGKAFLQ